VNEPTDVIAPDDLRVVRFVLHMRAPNGRPLAEALVWASTVIVVDEFMQHSLELAWPEDVGRGAAAESHHQRGLRAQRPGQGRLPARRLRARSAAGA